MPCDDFERAVILGGALREIGGDVFGRLQRPQDFIAVLDHLFGDLVSEGVLPGGLLAALEKRPDRDTFERSRDAELQFIYARYLDRLAGKGHRDGRDGLLDSAVAIAADPLALAERLGGRREIRLFGLQDLRRGWRQLLKALAETGVVERIVIYTAEELDLGIEPAPSVTWIGDRTGLPSRLFVPLRHSERGEGSDGAVLVPPGEIARSARDDSGPRVTVLSAPDVERELEHVARRVRDLADRGVPLHRIAVVARQARPYVDLALAALDRFGIPATARRRVAWSEIPIIRAVRCLLAAAAEGWTRHGLAELAEQPYFRNELDVRLVNYAGYRRRLRGLADWRRSLEAIAQEAEAYEKEEDERKEIDERRAPLPPAAWARQAAEGFARFAERAAALDEHRALKDWLTWLQDFLHADPWAMERRIWRIPDGRYDIARLDLAGWRGLGRLVDEWCDALEEWGGGEDRLTPEQFYRQFLDLLDGDAALWTEIHRGVQVLEALAAAYRSFDHVFLVGLESGRFPLPAPTSPVFDEREREDLAAAGLPLDSRAVWDHRERELFRVLVAGARESLTASSSLLDTSGREVIPSAFLEALGDVVTPVRHAVPCSEVVTLGARLGAPEGIARAADLAAIEWDRQRNRLSPYAGLIEAPELQAYVAQHLGESRVWSPTQLEAYAKCPWAYFSGRLLRLDRLEDPDEEMDHATRGTLLHDALSRFFTHAAGRAGSPVLLRAAHAEWVEAVAEQALDETIEAARGKRWLGSELLLGPKRLELRRILLGYLRWEVEENEKLFAGGRGGRLKRVRTAVESHEEKLEGIEFERDGIRIRFRGSVDRVEVGVDDRFDANGFVAAVDYKTTVYSCPGGGKPGAWSDGVVLQVPLYAYALAKLRPGRTAVRVEYRALKKPDTAHSLELYTVNKTASRAEADAKAIEKMQTALDAVVRHVRTARAGHFPVSPAPSCKCPSFCHSLEICRVPGGPDTGAW